MLNLNDWYGAGVLSEMGATIEPGARVQWYGTKAASYEQYSMGAVDGQRINLAEMMDAT